MVDRIVKVSLILAAADYIRGQAAAKKSTDATADAAQKAALRLQAQKEVLETTGRTGLLMGTLVAAGVALAVKRYAEFDQAMSNVIATGEDAKRNQDELRQAALDAGAATVFSATEAANAIEELAKAGVSARNILNGGLNASLDLAAAGGLGVADAAGIAATAMQQYNLRGEDMSHVSDLLAAGAGKAMGSVQDLGMALGQAGLVANGTGLSIEETTAGLSAFANAGLLGSDAGTSFKAMLQRLTPQSREAEKLMGELGISAYDAQGNFVGLANFAGNLQSALADLTPEQRNSALATIFGSDAVRAANILYEEGEQGIRDWTAAVDDQGYAAEVARTRLDNLTGDLEALGGAFDTVLIQSGSGANDTLRAMVQILTELLSQYGDLPPEIQSTVLAVGGVAAAVALTGGATAIAVPKWAAFKSAVAQSGVSLSRTALNAGAAGLALGGLFAIVGTLAQKQAEARERAQSYADALAQTGESADKAVRDLVAANLAASDSFLWLEGDSAYDAAKKLGLSIDLVTAAAEGNADAQSKLREELAAGGFGSQEFKDRLDELGLSLTDYSRLSTVVTQAVDAENAAQERGRELLDQKNEVTEESTGLSQSAAGAYLEAADGAEALNGELSELIEQINEANGVGQDAITANIAYEEALAKVDETIKSGEGTRNDHLGLLVDVADKAQSAAEKQFALDGDTNKYIDTLKAGRQALLDRAADLGLNADEAEALADQIFRIPTKKEMEVIAKTRAAQEAVDTFIRDNDNRTITLRVQTPGLRSTVSNDGGPGGFADGGQIPGTPSRRDNVLIHAATGEFIVNTEATGRNLALLHYINNGGRIPAFANGGQVQPRYASDAFRGGGTTRITIAPVVHAAPGMDEDTLTDKVVRRVERLLP